MSFIVVIPARYHSSRLQGKPLIKICNVPMILRTYRQCLKVVPNELIYIATDNEEIKLVCEDDGAQVILTSSTCLTGTDRVAEVAEKIKVDFYINVQGDEPIINPADIKKIISTAKKFPGEVINGYAQINSMDQFKSNSIPKVVMLDSGELLYMSRAEIPHSKTAGNYLNAKRQVCIYGFPFDSLMKFKSLNKKTKLEAIEDIEILRFIEMGISVRMVELSDESISVDVVDDIKKVEALLSHRLNK